MPHLQPLDQLFQRFTPMDVPHDDALDELPDDHPAKEYAPTERYAAWGATAIYGFVPFQAPTRR